MWKTQQSRSVCHFNFIVSFLLFSSFFLLFVLRFIFSTLFFEIQSDKAHTDKYTRSPSYVVHKAKPYGEQPSLRFYMFRPKNGVENSFSMRSIVFKRKSKQMFLRHTVVCCSVAVRCIWWCHQRAPHTHTHATLFRGDWKCLSYRTMPPTRMRSYSPKTEFFFLSFLFRRIRIKRIWSDWFAHEQTCIFHVLHDAFCSCFQFQQAARTNGPMKTEPNMAQNMMTNKCRECEMGD